VVGQPVEHGGGHLRVAEHIGMPLSSKRWSRVLS